MTDEELAKTDPRALAAEFSGLHEKDRKFVALGVEHYCKWLDGTAKDEKEQGRLEIAAQTEQVAATLRGQLVVPILGDDENEPTGIMEIQNRHILVIHNGLGRLVTRLKAAKGTVKPLGYTKWVDTLESAAAYVETQFQPRFAPQGELLPPEAKPMLVPDEVEEPPVPPAESVGGLKALAEAGEQVG